MTAHNYRLFVKTRTDIAAFYSTQHPKILNGNNKHPFLKIAKIESNLPQTLKTPKGDITGLWFTVDVSLHNIVFQSINEDKLKPAISRHLKATYDIAFFTFIDAQTSYGIKINTAINNWYNYIQIDGTDYIDLAKRSYSRRKKYLL